MVICSTHVFFYSQVLFYDHTVKIGKTTIASSSVHHQVADLCWGADFTSHLFCATSITTGDEEADSRGFHQIFDITKMQGLCRPDAKDAGHVCATSNDGRSLFLATRGSIFQNTLWQYDLARKDSHSISHIQLLPCFNRNQGKVTYISHSPDNIYLAVSGSCNQIHIYDSRFLGKGPLFQYAHTSSIAYTSSGSYGVVKADWSSGHAGGQYLISGGADGCIRVWDTNRAHERDNGWVWFNMNYDIGHFSLGNVDNGEKALIVGSLAGDVYSLD
ncbi:hypothetical protein K474DRAFT_600032 [Panus rudis PR-1116 ss-1]|nr:hypothetical protein K474DRAFT_600032 [Panus rudis PR-1116 ss-1]